MKGAFAMNYFQRVIGSEVQELNEEDMPVI